MISIRTELGTQMLKYGSRLSGVRYVKVVYQDPKQGLLMIMMSSHPFDIPKATVHEQDTQQIGELTVAVH